MLILILILTEQLQAQKKHTEINLTHDIIYMIKFSILSYLLVPGTCTLLVNKGGSHVCMHFCFDSFHTFKKVFCKIEFVSVWILADKKISYS